MSSESYWRVKKKFYANSISEKLKMHKRQFIGDFYDEIMQTLRHEEASKDLTYFPPFFSFPS